MVKLPKEVIDLLREPQTIRVLTTTGEDGLPHTVFKGSMTALDEETLAFIELLDPSRTNKNMLRNLWDKKTVVVSLFDPQDNCSYQIKGLPYKYVEEGPIWEQFLEETWKIMPDVNPAGVWLIRPQSVFNEGYSERLQEVEKEFKPSFSFWMKYHGKRL